MSVREPGVHVRFFKLAMLNGVESKAAGRPIYVDKDHVEIQVAGQDKDKFVGPANEQQQQRFPEEWAQYQKGEQMVRVGTPIEQWPQMTPSQVLMLKNVSVYTVEDVATLSDENVRNLGPGGYKMRSDAQKFLSLAQASADVEQMEALRATNADLQAQLADLAAKVEALSKPAEEKKPRKQRESAES